MSPQPNQPQGTSLQVKAGDEELKGRYANLMQVSHTAEEFLLDFYLLHPPAGQLAARIVTSPGHLKRIVAALQDNLKKYESQFGKVEAANEPSGEFGFKV
jgi:Protein of unknown function (DUF3467)